VAAGNSDALAVHEQDATSYREQSQATWDAAAGGWELERDRMWEATRAVSEGLVEMAAPGAGEIVLDIAAGAGDTGFLAAGLIGPQGRLISTDRSPQMLAVAERGAQRRGLANVEFRLIDAEAMELVDASVDVVLCRWGYMLMADPAAALAETRRVLRPQGRLALAVWGARGDNPWNTVVMDAFIERGLLPAPGQDEPGMFRLADRGRLEALLRGAGFESVQLRDLPVAWRFDQIDEYWAILTNVSRAMQSALQTLGDDEVAAIKADVAGRCEPYRRAGGGYELPGLTLAALAR
jgi:ubiquinone/menaquinone biosynthesis C-methylase UbiE